MRGRQEAFRAASDPSSCSSWKCEYIDDAVQCTHNKLKQTFYLDVPTFRPSFLNTRWLVLRALLTFGLGAGASYFLMRRDLRSATETPTEKVPAETPVERTAETPTEEAETPVEWAVNTPTEEIETPVEWAVNTPTEEIETPVEETADPPPDPPVDPPPDPPVDPPPDPPVEEAWDERLSFPVLDSEGGF